MCTNLASQIIDEKKAYFYNCGVFIEVEVLMMYVIPEIVDTSSKIICMFYKIQNKVYKSGFELMIIEKRRRKKMLKN